MMCSMRVRTCLCDLSPTGHPTSAHNPFRGTSRTWGSHPALVATPRPWGAAVPDSAAWVRGAGWRWNRHRARDRERAR